MSKPVSETTRIDINLAVLHRGGGRFEVVVDPDLAVEFKTGKISNVAEVLKSQKIFSDAQKGMLASEHLIKNVFGTVEPLKVAERIIREGEIQLSAEFRRKLREQKRARIIELIHRYSINPQTNTPHTRERIGAAMDEARVKIDEHKPAEEQVEAVLKAINPILPIRYETRLIQVIIEPRYAPQSYSILKSLGTIEQSSWQGDGSLLARIRLPAGMQNELFDRLNSLTHGSADIKIIKE